MKDTKFIERRREYRLPFMEKAIFTDGTKTITARCGNISRGGMFLLTLDPFPIESEGHLLFMLPGQSDSLCLKAKAVHIVQETKKCEIECGMGFIFSELTSHARSRLNLFILAEQMAYMELRDILKAERPDNKLMLKIINKLPWLKGLDLLGMRYRVDRVCAMFEAFANLPQVSKTA